MENWNTNLMDTMIISEYLEMEQLEKEFRELFERTLKMEKELDKIK